MKIPRIGVGVLVSKENQILFGKRKGSHGAGSWGFPGGHLEHGEEVVDCARRELFEETGLLGLEFREGPWVNTFFGEHHYITIFMILTKYEGTIELKEPNKCETWQWFEKDKPPTPLFSPARQFLERFAVDSFAWSPK